MAIKIVKSELIPVVGRVQATCACSDGTTCSTCG